MMAVNSLPIVIREMRVAARKPWIYWARLGMAMAGIAAWLFIFLNGPHGTSQKGMALLVVLSAMAMVLALLSGVFLTADCLSEEKREGTLGLLFLTPLRGYDVVFGKLVANAAVSFFGLLSILPILCLPLLTGGVTWAETQRVMLVLLLALALSLSLGMFVSAKALDSRKVFVATLLAVVLLAGVPMLALFFQQVILRRMVLENPFSQFSPIYTLMFAFDVHYNIPASKLHSSGASAFWRSAGILGLMALTLLTLASRIIRYSWQTGTSGSTDEKEATKIIRKRKTEQRRPKLPGLIRGADLYAWLCWHGSALGAGTRWFFGVLTVFWFVMLMISGTTRAREGAFVIAFFTAFAMHVIMKSIFALEATRQIHQDLRSGNMQILLATPLHEREIALGQVRAYRKRFRAPLAFLTGINLLMELAIFVFYDHLHMRNEAKVFSVLFLGGILALRMDCRAIQWVGIWKSLQAQTHLKATFATLKGILGIPWVLFPIMFVIAVNQRGTRTDEVLFVMISFWFLFGLGLDLFFIAKAKWHLRTRFRELAANFGT